MKKTATLIDGRVLAALWRDDIAEQIRALGAPLGLAAVAEEGNNELRAFVKLKERAAREVGVSCSSYFVKTRAEAEDTIRFLAGDESVHGIFVELPMPTGWESALSLLPPEKDVDALTLHPFVPAPAVRALEYLCAANAINVDGITAVVVGNGRLVGRPVATWLRSRGAVVSVIDIDTPEPAAISARADIVVTGVGTPGLVGAEWIKDGATVIDFGYADGKGDVDLESVKRKAGVVSPVPGGMGPLVIAAVLENLLTLATR